MLDLDVLVTASRFIAVTSSSMGARNACDAELDPFTGAELVAAVLHVPAVSAAQLLQAYGEPLTVADALGRRGAVVQNPAGRVAVVVGPLRLVEPAGRRYALTNTAASWWVTGWWLRPVTSTLVPA